MRDEKILIVEDEVVIALVLEEMLKNLGFDKISITHNFHEGEMMINKEIFNMILMDINLGSNRDGIDLAKKVALQNNHTPIIFITGNSDFKTFTKAKYANPSNIIIKPVTENDLMIKLELAFHQNQKNTLGTVEEALKRNISLKDLTARQLEVLRLLILGESNKMIAEKLDVSPKTVDGHRTKIMKILNAKNTADLVRIAIGF